MAIDINVKDQIDDTIETKLRGMANAAAALDRNLKKVSKGMGALALGGSVSGSASAMASLMPTGGSVATAATMSKRVESAFVTKQKELEKTRKDITAAFETGFKAREKQTADIIKMIERQKRDVDFNSVLGIGKPSSAAALKRQQAEYDQLFGAHKITTQAPKQNLRNVIDQNVGVKNTSSVAAIKAQQKAYDELFNAVQPSKFTPITDNMIKASMAQNKWTTSADNTSSAMQRLDKSVSFLRSDGLRWAKVLWALGGATLTAGAIIQAADAYTRLQNRLSVVAETQGDVNNLTSEMLRIANSSRQPIEETAKTFTRFDLAMQQIGRSQKDSMQLTENVAKALKLGGASAGEAASALLQLSQAFNKGKLDGDEFRSMMENSPLLADALAKQLKVTRGELLKLAPKGKLTAQVMADAWLKATDDINKAFAKLRPTIAESFTMLRNNVTVFFGQLDKSLGITAAFSAAIMGLGNHLDTLLFVFLSLSPIIATFIGAQAISALGVFSGFVARTAVSIGALRSPLTVATVALFNMGRTAISAGTSMVAAFTSSNTRAIMLQLSIARLTAGTLALAGVAQRAGLAMLSMFSFGNILMILTVATAAAFSFGDQLVINAQKGYTMRDAVVAAFKTIWMYAKEVGVFITDLFFGMFKGIDVSSKTTGEKMLIMFGMIANGAATAFDAVVGEAIAAYRALQGIYNMMASIYNLATAFSVFNGGSYKENIGAALLNGADAQVAFEKGVTEQTDFAKNALKNVVEDFNTNLAKVKSARDAQMKLSDPKQRTAAKPTADDKKDKKTDAEKRADMIQKVINKEKSAIEVAKLLGDERERQSVIEDLNNRLRQKGYAILNKGENDAIEKLVQQRIETERVGEAMNDYFDRVWKAQREFKTARAAVTTMLKGNVITKDMADSFMAEANDKYAQATDHVYEYTKALNKAKALSSLSGLAAEQEAAVYDAREKARGSSVPFTEADAQRIRETIAETKRYTDVTAALTSLFDKTSGALLENQTNIKALNAYYEAGAISVGMYTTELAKLKAEQGTINEMKVGISADDPFEPIRRGFYQFVGEMPMLGQAMADAIDSTLKNSLDGVANTLTDMIVDFNAYGNTVADALGRPVSTLEVMRYALADIISQVGKELINAIIKMGIQWAVTQAMQAAASKAAIASTTAAQTASMTTIAGVAAPAAMTTSVATSGGAAAAGVSGMTMAMMAVAGIMALAMGSLGKYQDGGVLGGMGTGRSDSTLFLGSRGEMIMNKGAVERNGPMLHAMNQGQSVGSNFIDNSIHVSVVYQDGKRTSTDSGGDAFTDDLVRFIDSRVQRGVNGVMKQGKQGY